MNPNTPKDRATGSGHVPHHPTLSREVEDTAEPEGQFPHAAHEAPVNGQVDSPVDSEDAHVGATEEQVGDLTGPGAGYDETSGEQAASLPQGGQGMGQGRGANAGQTQKDEKKDEKDNDVNEAEIEEKRQDPPASPNQHKREDPPARSA